MYMHVFIYIYIYIYIYDLASGDIYWVVAAAE